MAEVAKVSYTHEKMIDLLVANPRVRNRELAEVFGYTEPWVSTVLNSDAFRERLAARREDVVDPVLRMSLEERIRGTMDLALTVLGEELVESRAPSVAIKVLEHGSRALGYGAGQRANVVVQNYVAVVPPKSLDSAAWSEAHAPVRNANAYESTLISQREAPEVLPISQRGGYEPVSTRVVEPNGGSKQGTDN
jgi:hypothetical protein